MKKAPAQNIIALDIGGTNLRVALVSPTGEIIVKKMFPTPQTGGARVISDALVNAVNKLGVRNVSRACAIGVSVAGPVNVTKGTFDAPTLKLTDIAVTEPLAKAFGLPVSLLNDTKAAVFAEHTVGHGKSRAISHILYITISSGIGVGAVVDDRLLLGRDQSAGELGHATVSNLYNPRTHSWEHYCAGKKDPAKGIVHFYRSWCGATGEVINTKITKPQHVFGGATRGDTQLQSFMNVVGELNAQGVTTAMLAYNPQVIVFGGGIACNHWDLIIKGIRKNIRRDIITPLPRLVLTNLGDSVSLIGAALYAKNQLSSL